MGDFKAMDGAALRASVVGSLGDVADNLRDVGVRLGIRPYRVRLVWTRWTGRRRGHGVEEVVRTEEVLPMPKVDGIESISADATQWGVEESGGVTVSQISPRYTEDQLRGRGPNGEPLTAAEQFYWEVEAPGVGGSPGERRRFTVATTPVYQPGRLHWVVGLVRAHEARERSGEPAI